MMHRWSVRTTAPGSSAETRATCHAVRSTSSASSRSDIEPVGRVSSITSSSSSFVSFARLQNGGSRRVRALGSERVSRAEEKGDASCFSPVTYAGAVVFPRARRLARRVLVSTRRYVSLRISRASQNATRNVLAAATARCQRPRAYHTGASGARAKRRHSSRFLSTPIDVSSRSSSQKPHRFIAMSRHSAGRDAARRQERHVARAASTAGMPPRGSSAKREKIRCRISSGSSGAKTARASSSTRRRLALGGVGRGDAPGETSSSATPPNDPAGSSAGAIRPPTARATLAMRHSTTERSLFHPVERSSRLFRVSKIRTRRWRRPLGRRTVRTRRAWLGSRSRARGRAGSTPARSARCGGACRATGGAGSTSSRTSGARMGSTVKAAPRARASGAHPPGPPRALGAAKALRRGGATAEPPPRLALDRRPRDEALCPEGSPRTSA